MEASRRPLVRVILNRKTSLQGQLHVSNRFLSLLLVNHDDRRVCKERKRTEKPVGNEFD